MPYYIFNFKKGDLSLEFESTDHRFVSYQMEKWIKEVAEINLEEPIPPKKPAKTIKKQYKPVKKVIQEEDIEVITNEKTQVSDSVDELEKQVESALKATKNVIKESNEIKQTIKTHEFDNFDAKTPEITGIIGDIQKPATEEKTSALDINEKAQNNKFYKILQEKFSSLPEMVQNNVEKNLQEQTQADNCTDTVSIAEFIDLKNPDTPLEFLLVAAYYLKEYDLLDRYSLKQINSKIIKFIQKPINHSVIQDAVSKSFIAVVPDYTGMADVTEYIITSEGINYLINEM